MLTVLIRSLAAAEQLNAAALIFSAKETFFKCQFAVTGQWLDFQAVTVELSGRRPGVRKFWIRPLVKVALQERAAMPLDGRFEFTGNFVITGMALAASQEALGK